VSGRAAAAGLVLLAACSSPPPEIGHGFDGSALPCSTKGTPTPHVSVSPAVSLRTVCGVDTGATVATVEEPVDVLATWYLKVEGDPAFKADESVLLTCQADGAAMASVSLQPPRTAIPGDTFEATATVSALDDAFPEATVELHGEIVLPTVTVDDGVGELGETVTGTAASQMFSFHAEERVIAVAPPPDEPPFFFTVRNTGPGVFQARVSAVGVTPGDYRISSQWKAGVLDAPDACLWTKTLDLHVRIVERPAGADAGGDGP
jgi:hypothetical protein